MVRTRTQDPNILIVKIVSVGTLINLGQWSRCWVLEFEAIRTWKVLENSLKVWEP